MQEKVTKWGGVLVVLAAAAGAAYRLPFGVDITDESFYVAVALRLANGARPFADEINITQTAAFFVAPFVKVYTALAGLDGLVLFTRVLNLLFRGVATVAVFAGARHLLPPGIAAAAATLTLVYTPFNIPSNSYNSLAVLGFTAGCFLALDAAARDSRRAAAASGFCHAVACVAYPPMAGAFAFFLAAWLFVRRRELVRSAAELLGGAALPALGLVAVIAWSGAAAFADVVQYASAVNPRTGSLVERIWPTLRDVLILSPSRLPLGALVAAVALSAFRPLRFLRFAALGIPPLAATAPYYGPHHTHSAIAWIALAGLSVMVPLARDREARRAFALLVLPGLLAGALTSAVSSVSYVNFAIGAFAATQGCVVLLARHLFRGAATPANEGRFGAAAGIVRAAAALALCAAAAGVVLAGQLRPGFMYREDDLPQLTETVRAGAFAGLRTTPAKAAFLERAAGDLARYAPSTVFVYYDFPAAYLLTEARPETPSVWIFAHGSRGFRTPEQVFRASGRWPGAVVRTLAMPFSSTLTVSPEYSPDDPLDTAVRQRYRRVIARPEYEIYVR